MYNSKTTSQQASDRRQPQGPQDTKQDLAETTFSSIGDDDEEALSSQYATSSQLDDELAYERSTPGHGTPNHASNTSGSNISSPTGQQMDVKGSIQSGKQKEKRGRKKVCIRTR